MPRPLFGHQPVAEAPPPVQEVTHYYPRREPDSVLIAEAHALNDHRREQIRRESAKLHEPRVAPHRLDDKAARKLIQEGNDALAEVTAATNLLKAAHDAALAEVTRLEARIQTLQAGYRESLERRASNPLAPAPRSINDDVAQARVELEIAYDRRDAAAKDQNGASAAYGPAMAKARELIDAGYRSLTLTAADRLTDLLEHTTSEAALLHGAINGLLDRAVLEKNHELIQYLNRCLIGQRFTSPQQEMDRRVRVSNEADTMRERYRRRDALTGANLGQ